MKANNHAPSDIQQNSLLLFELVHQFLKNFHCQENTAAIVVVAPIIPL
jgi:hypothetical protein